MPYFGRAVGRAKGIGKIVYWDQGGGPKKAGLGPQIDVTTWGRRVIARRTNNCCCDPIELTSIRVSIPWGTSRFERTPWNYWQAQASENEPLGLVGPPRNDVVDGVIQTQRQIYTIVTFNKPISGNLSSSLVSPTYTPSVPSGTQICLCGLEQVREPNSQGSTVCIQDNSINVASIMRYYDITERYTSVTQIPGGTSIDTTTPTTNNNATNAPSGHLTSGSRVLVEPSSTGYGDKPQNPINNASNPNGGVVVDMWSGQNNTNSLGRWDASQNVNSPFDGRVLASFPWQLGAGGGVIPDYYGAYSTPLMDVSNGGFAIPSSSVYYTLTPQLRKVNNRYIGNGYGVYFNNRRCEIPLVSNINAGAAQPLIPADDAKRRNIALVQGDYAAGLNEFYSADALYVSDGPVNWLEGDYALFINITSLMQVSLKNPRARSNTDSPASTNAGPPVQPGQPNNNNFPQFTSTTASWFAPETPTTGTLPGPVPDTDSGPWQSWGIKQTGNSVPGAIPTVLVPAWADLYYSSFGIQWQPHITLDNSGTAATGYATNSAGGPPLNPPPPIFPDPNYNPSRWGATLGDIVEKLRQFTYSAFPSYTIQNILSSKYDCGNDGFDGPVDDIRLSSGSAANKAISSARQAEGGVLTLLAFSLPAAAASASAATPALPPTVGPSPPGGGGGTTPLPPGTTPLPPGGGVTPISPIGGGIISSGGL